MNKEDLVLSLNRILANYFIVYIKLFRYQWYICGPHAYPLKQLFAEMQREIDILIHELSEYILSLDGRPYATMVKFLKESSIEEATADDEEKEIINQLDEDLEELLQQIAALVKDTEDKSAGYFLYDMERTLKPRHALIEKMLN